jgi:DNA invertase Pin-like site-specific DNA recombinase
VTEKRAALYARVSTAAQDYEPQRADLARYIGARAWALEREYVEIASGADSARPQLARLMADAFRHEFDVVVVWRFDRFSRSTSHLLQSLEKFREWKIDFVSLCEQIDTSTPAGKMVFTNLAAVAEFEKNLRAERIQMGIEHARASGKHCGRSANAVDEEKIRLDYAALHSVRKVARLNRLSVGLTHSIIKGTRDLSESATQSLNNNGDSNS